MGDAQLILSLEPADQPEVIALIDALDAYQTVLYPLESHHGVDIDVLRQSNVLFAVAREVRQVVGCGAVLLHEDHGELKRMYVPPEMRGRGLGRELLEFLERQAQARGCKVLRLETGIHQPEALRLYERAGFMIRSPFGSYIEDPNSVFMEKHLMAGSAI